MISGISSNMPSFSFGMGSITKSPVVLTLLAVTILSNIPTVSAGAQAYFACIQTCCGGGTPQTWWHAVLCPTLCAPFLAAPGG